MDEDGFKWNIMSDTEEDKKADNTVAPKALAKTGERTFFIVAILVLGLVAGIFIKKSKNLY